MDMWWLFIIPGVAFLMAVVHLCTKYPSTNCPDHKEVKMVCIGGHGVTIGSIDVVTFWLCPKCNQIWISFPGQTEMHLPRDRDEAIYAEMYLEEYKEKQGKYQNDKETTSSRI